jgi:histone-lysine N-methyltransferase SETMAR
VLTGAHKTQSGFGFDFLEQYYKDGDAFLNHIIQVTSDETWVSFVNAETKEQSKHWIHTHSTNRESLNNRKEVLIVEFMLEGTTITSEVYCETVKKLRRTIQNKRRGTLTSGVLLLHDNSRRSARTRSLLKHFNWELFDHPPYSPDLAQSDYHLFTYQKNWLRSQRFNNNEELMEDVKTWLSSQAADFFDTGI